MSNQLPTPSDQPSSSPPKPEGFRLPWWPAPEAPRARTDIHVHTNWFVAGFWLGIGFWAAGVVVTVVTIFVLASLLAGGGLSLPRLFPTPTP